MLDVLLQHLVELRIRRQRVFVELVVAQLGARRAVDDRLRDQLAPDSLVQVAREPKDVRLVDVLQQREAAGHVAVERRVSHRELRLVAGRDEHPAELVRHCHQQHAASPCLDVLFREVGLGSGERFLERLFERIDDFADRDLDEWTAKALGKPAGVRTRTLRGVARAHRDAVHALRPECLRREGGGHRGVDPSRHADHHFLEPVLADVVS